MILREGEPARFLDAFPISPKTSNRVLKEWSSQRWPRDGKRCVARDIVMNGQELFKGSDIDWKMVLGSIRVERLGIVQLGEAAIAISDASLVGSLAAQTNWPMHDPSIVYLSGKCFTNRVSDKLQDFKREMLEASVVYGQKAIPNADLYMEVLNFFLKLPNRDMNRSILNKLAGFLKNGNIDEAYREVKLRDDSVRRLGQDFSRTTTSSILIPPKPGM